MEVSTDWVELNNGIKVKFSSLTDWVVDDTWEFTASSTDCWVFKEVKTRQYAGSGC